MPPKRSDDHSLKRYRDKTPARGRRESPERDTSQRRNPREPSQRRQRDASPPESSRREAPTRRSNNRGEFQVPASPDSPTPTKKSKRSSDAASSSRGNGSTTDTSTLRRSSRLASDSDDSMSTSSQSTSRSSGILRDGGSRVPRRDSSRPRNSVRFGDQESPVPSMNNSNVRDSRSRQVERPSTSARRQSTQRNSNRESTSNREQSRPREPRRDEIESTASSGRSRSRTSRIDHGEGTSGGPSGSQPTSTRPSRSVSRVQPDRRSKSKPKIPEIRRDVSTMESQSTTNRNRSVSPSPSPTSSGGKSSHRSRSQQPQNTKDKVPFAKIIEKVHQDSIEWFAKCCVVSKFKLENRNSLSADVLRVLDKLKRDVEEPDCFSQKIPMPQRNMATTQDYRMLDHHFNKLVLSVKRTGATQARFDRKLPKGPTFTGDMYLDPTNTSADRVVEAAQEMLETGRNTIYEPLNETRMRNLPFERTGALESDLAFFKKYPSRDNSTKQPKPGHLPVAVYEIESNSERDIEKLKESLTATSIALVRNARDVFGLNSEKFNLDAMERIDSDADVEVVRQIPQPISSNYQLHNPTRRSDENWAAVLDKHEVKFSQFASYYRSVEQLTVRVLERIIESPSTHENVLRHLAEDLKSHQLTLPRHIKADRDATAIAFGTNVDVLDAPKFAEQNQEIAKLPEFVQPIGTKSFWIKVRDNLPGITCAQIYYKVPGVRTFPHQENGCLASVNINLGGGECVWISVPMEFSGMLQNLVREKLGLRDGESIFTRGFWPVLQCCLEAGIPIQKFTQKPGDMVVVGPGTYHWVQSNDITTHIAWNIARPTFIQLASIGISHDHYLANKYTPMIPIESFIWSLAGHKLRGDFIPLLKHFLCRSLVNCQFEFVFIQRKQYTRLNANQKPNLKPVERCQISTCGKCLFNTIPVDRAGNVLCYECLQRAGLLELKADIRVYIRFEMTALKDKYNAVVCHPQ